MGKTVEEKREYARGYQAGRKKREADLEGLRRKLSDQEFHDKAFLAALPFAMEQDSWRVGEEKIHTIEQRVAFANLIADEALRQRRRRA